MISCSYVKFSLLCWHSQFSKHESVVVASLVNIALLASIDITVYGRLRAVQYYPELCA